MSARGPAAGNFRGLPQKTWYFTFDLQASEAGVTSQLEAFESSTFRNQSIKTASIISFSRSADGSPDIWGFISGKTMWKSTMQIWLTNSALSNLQLHPISDRFSDPFIVSFLADSELPAAGGIHHAGAQDPHGHHESKRRPTREGADAHERGRLHLGAR